MPLHQSLFTRLLITSLLVALCAVVATAWLAVKSTTRAIQREQGQSLADDARIYDDLLGWAAVHPRWDGVRPDLVELAGQTGRQITLTGEDGTIIASSETTPPPLPPRPSAVVDPLAVNTVLASGRDDTSGIDARAVGPYRPLTEEETALADDLAQNAPQCMSEPGILSAVIKEQSGRSGSATGDDRVSKFLAECYLKLGLAAPTLPEDVALEELTRLTNTCLDRQDHGPVVVLIGFFWMPVLEEGEKQEYGASATDQAVRACVDSSRREQLRGYVAPAALLFVTSPGRSADPVFVRSRENTLRIAGVAALVLALAAAVTLLVGIRLVRPLRALTLAASHPAGAESMPRLPVRGNDEIGRLTAAFNDLSARREATERQRRTMVSDIAHELGTPLTNIRAWLEAAKDGVAPTDPELLDLLSDEAVLLQHVIDDLRDLAAADAGNLRLHPEAVYVNDLLEQVAAAHRGRADASGVAIVTETSGDPEVMADPTRVRQAVGNLISNAVRHSRPGAVVTLRSRLAGEILVIDVVDTGTGIAAADLPHVFDRFWRADKSRNRHTGGSGLGLAIVRKLAEAHGGTVGVTSEPGRGSTFTLRLPVTL